MTTVRHTDNAYNLFELSLTIKNGSKISLTEVLSVMEIFEDIYSKSIHGYVEITDSVGGLEKFVITGGETISLTITKPLPDTEVIISRQDLIVHQVSKPQMRDNSTMRYKLHFMPESALKSQKKRIYRSFRKDKKLSGMVSKIYNDVGGSNIFINIRDEDAKIPIEKNFVCPGYSPYDAIDYLAKRACFSGDYFTFFERLNKVEGKPHVFSGIKDLRDYWEAKPVPIIKYQPSATNYSEETAVLLRAQRLQIQSNFDHMSNMGMGFYNSRLRMLDIVGRRFSDTKLNYGNIQDTLRANKMLTNDNIFMSYDDNYPEFPGERMSIAPRHEIIKNKSVWARNEVFGAITLSNLRINVDISGATNKIGAGNVVDLAMPSMHAKALNLESAIVSEDMVYSGRYVVTAVRHVFTIREYFKIVEISRDSGRLNLDRIVSDFSSVPFAPPPGSTDPAPVNFSQVVASAPVANLPQAITPASVSSTSGNVIEDITSGGQFSSGSIIDNGSGG